MATPWIESHTVLMRHRKVVKLARELRLRKSYVLGHLHALWHAVLEQQEDGDLSSWTDEMIAEYADFPNDAQRFVRLLQETRFLDDRLIHDWIDYAGKYLTLRYATSNRQRLIEIWAKHGRTYGSNQKASEQQTESNHTYQTDLPNRPHQRAGGGSKSDKTARVIAGMRGVR